MSRRYAARQMSATQETARKQPAAGQWLTRSLQDDAADRGLDVSGGVGPDRVETVSGGSRNPLHPHMRPIVEPDHIHPERQAAGLGLQLSGDEKRRAGVARPGSPVARVPRSPAERAVA